MHKCLPNIEVEFSGNHIDSGEKYRNNYFSKAMSMNVFIKSRGSDKIIQNGVHNMHAYMGMEFITCKIYMLQWEIISFRL
jgi:hypothetical protein